MPYKSDAQRKYFNANRDKLEAQGVDVDEWNESSRGKKLPEKVKEKEASDALNMLHRQASQLLAKFAAEEYERRPKDESENKKPVKKAPPSAKELVNMDSTGGALADYIVPGLWGGERAGRTQAMADAIGEKTTFGVRHPLLQSWGYGLGGGALGALLGGGAGLLAGGLTGGPRSADELAPIGALLGGGAGFLGGGLLAGRHRRDEMKRVGHFYDQDAAEGKLKPKNPKFSILSALLMPGRGPHRVGQLEATRAIRGDKSMGDQRGGGRDVLYSSRFLPYVGGPMGLLHGYGQNIRTQLASEGDDNAVADSFERRPKAASDVEGSDIQTLAKLAASDYDEEKKQKSEAKKDEKHQARKNLGPREHAYVADSLGGRAVQNASRKLKEMHNDPDNPYQSSYDRFLTMQGGLGESLGERISRGSARMAESPGWRALSVLDPTASGQQEGIIGALSGFGGGEDKAEGAKRRAAEAYAKFLKRHQDKVDPKAKTTERETPFHINSQGMLANLDSDIAGHNYMRNERPLHYWLNPLSKSGPLAELGDRGVRRIIAAQASPESTLGRFGVGAGGLATLGLLPMLMGGEGAQQKLRASAVKNKLYAPEAMPAEKAASMIALLAQTMAKQARCWEGYEPVPGKEPYSEDSCRPKGSSKKKEKKAESCSCGGPKDACTCDSGPDQSDQSNIAKLARALAKQADGGAWTRDEGQSDSGGLNAKGRASLKAQGHDIKPPVTEDNPKGERAGRKASFCARMGGMKSKLTSSETANDPDSRINKALRKWNC